MATEANLRELRRTKRGDPCGSRRAVVGRHLPIIRSGPWTVVRSSATEQPPIEVHGPPSITATDEPTERWLSCRSAGCRLGEPQMYDGRLTKARQRVAKFRQQVVVGTFTTPHVIRAKAKKAVGRPHDLRGIFTLGLRRANDGQPLHVAESATALQDERDLQGVYLLRTTVADLTPGDPWAMYMLLTRGEAAFRRLKTDSPIRPIYQHEGNRGDAQVLFAVLA